MKDRRRSYLWGIIAEWLCMGVLVLKGYAILAHRYRNHWGEIDIVAQRGRVVAFIEVKARANSVAALHSVTPLKQQRLTRAASGFVASHALYAHHGLRFDMMVVTSPFNIRHLEDAWRVK